MEMNLKVVEKVPKERKVQKETKVLKETKGRKERKVQQKPWQRYPLSVLFQKWELMDQQWVSIQEVNYILVVKDYMLEKENMLKKENMLEKEKALEKMYVMVELDMGKVADNTEEAVYAEGARRQGEGIEDGSVYEDAEEEQAQEEDEEEDGGEVDPLYRGKKDDDDTKDPDVEDEYERRLKGQSSGNSGERRTRRKIESTPTTGGEKVADGEMCKVNYDMVVTARGATSSGALWF